MQVIDRELEDGHTKLTANHALRPVAAARHGWILKWQLLT